MVLKTSKIFLEPKDDIKARLGKSPNDADAFVLTFAFPVVKIDWGPGAEFGRGKVVHMILRHEISNVGPQRFLINCKL